MNRMPRLCAVFPSEYQHEFNKKKIIYLEPYRPVEHWEEEIIPETEDAIERSKKLAEKLILDRYHTMYDLHFNKCFSEKESDVELDLGSELVKYLQHLYDEKPSEKEVPRVPYTTTRVCGYASPQTLRGQLSNYQDTYGRTGGKVILKNVQKIIAAKRRQIIQSKLQANTEL